MEERREHNENVSNCSNNNRKDDKAVLVHSRRTDRSPELELHVIPELPAGGCDVGRVEVRHLLLLRTHLSARFKLPRKDAQIKHKQHTITSK